MVRSNKRSRMTLESSNLLHHLEPETVKFIDILETIFFQEVQSFQRIVELILEQILLNTIHFNTYLLHDLSIDYEEGQDSISVNHSLFIVYDY